MLTIFLGLALVAVVFYAFFVKPMSYWKKHGVRQGNPQWVFGDSWSQLFQVQSVGEILQNLYNQCPGTRYFGVYEFTSPVLLVKDPELIKQMSIKDFDHFTDHVNFMGENSDPLWDRTLPILKGQEWNSMRTILSPSFTSSKMKGMFTLMTECAENFMEYFLKGNEAIQTLDMKDVLTRFTNDVTATTNFGVEVDSLSEPKNEFYLMAKEPTKFGFWKTFKISIHTFLPKIFNAKVFDTEVANFFSKIINKTLEVRGKNGIVRYDMIHLLMEAQKELAKPDANGIIDKGASKKQMEISNLDIISSVLIFLFGGFDSVSGLMCFTSYELALNPEIQDRLRNEIRATLEEGDGKLTYEGISKMKYMDMVLSESLRKWPTFPRTDRACTKPYVIQPKTPDEKPVYLEKGTMIWYPIFAIHRDPNYYPDPDRFDPERFSDDNKGNRKPSTYLPFGIGPRNCIGSRFALLEAKILFSYILKYFQIVPVEKTQIPLEMSKSGITVDAADGFWLGLKRIQNAVSTN